MPLRAVLFDIGDTLWAFPGDDRNVAIPHFERVRMLFSAHAEAPTAQEMLEALQRRFAREREESPRRQPPGTQASTWLLAKEAFATLGFEPPDGELREFAAIAFDFEAELAVSQEPEPEMPQVLTGLRERGLRLAAVSNTFVTTHTLARIFEARGIVHLIDEVVSSADVGFRKPSAHCFLPALGALAVEPAEAIMVGDRLDTDIEGALGLGMTAVLTHQYRQEDPGPSPFKPHHVIAHLSDLIPIVESMDR